MYARRYIDITLSGKGSPVTFNARGKYALRVFARIQKAGAIQGSIAQIAIHGLNMDHINQLSTYGTYYHPNNDYQIEVSAGDDKNGMSTVFSGVITQAWADMRAMPNCPFYIVATGIGGASVYKVAPTSMEGPTQVSTILEQLAQKAKVKWEDNGIKCVINDPYFWGSPWKQIQEVLQAAGINGVIDDGTLAAWNQDGHRQGNVIEIAPNRGLRDYPSFTEYGIQVRTEFRRALTFGGQMKVTSDIKPANGVWNIINIDYDLQSNTPGGAWYATLDGAQMGAPITGGR